MRGRARPRLGGDLALRSNPLWGVRGDQADGCGVFGGGRGIRDGDHRRAHRFDLGRDLRDLDVALVAGHVADVDGFYAARMLDDRLTVDLRVLFPRVPDQNERQVRVRRQQRADDAELVVVVLAEGSGAPVFQEQRARGQAVDVQKVLEQVVDVPGAARDVEDRVLQAFLGTPSQGLVEGRYTGKRQPRVGVVAHDDPGHLHHVRGAGVDDRVVEVANHGELRPSWNQDVPRRAHGPHAGGIRVEKLELHRVPTVRRARRLLKLQGDVEEALLVGHDVRAYVSERGPDPGAGDLVAAEASGRVAQVLPQGIVVHRAADALLLEHPAPQEQPPVRAVSPVG